MKDSFILYNKYQETVDALSDEEAGKLIKAILEYSNTGKCELEGILKAVFIQIKQDIDYNNQKYEEICKRNQANGQKGGRPKKTDNPLGFLENPEEPKKADYDYEYDNEYDYEVIKEEEKEEEKSDSRDGGSIISFYEQNIGTMSPYTFEVISDYQKDFPDDVILYALKLAVEANAKNIKYIKAILNSWKNSNVKTLIDAQNENKRRQPKEADKPPNNAYHNAQYGDLSKYYANL